MWTTSCGTVVLGVLWWCSTLCEVLYCIRGGVVVYVSCGGVVVYVWYSLVVECGALEGPGLGISAL